MGTSRYWTARNEADSGRIDELTDIGDFHGVIDASILDEVKSGSKSAALDDRLELSTAAIGLSVRTVNCLEERGFFTVRDLLHCTKDDLLGIANFGQKTREEVFKALEEIGFCRPPK